MASLEKERHSLKQSEAKDFDQLKDIEQAQMADDLNILNRAQLLKGCKVLDLGCGTGNYTYMLAERVGPTGSVIGVDPDKERIKIAIEKWTRDNLTFMVGDDQTYPEDQYDLIFSHYVIHWIKNKQQTFERAYKNLKPGGQFAFVAAHAISPEGEEMSTLMDADGYKAIKNQWYYIPAEKYKELAEGIGFTVTLIEEGCDVCNLPNVDVLISIWHGITEGKFDASKINQALLENFKQKHSETSNGIDFRQPVIRLILTKL